MKTCRHEATRTDGGYWTEGAVERCAACGEPVGVWRKPTADERSQLNAAYRQAPPAGMIVKTYDTALVLDKGP